MPLCPCLSQQSWSQAVDDCVPPQTCQTNGALEFPLSMYTENYKCCNFKIFLIFVFLSLSIKHGLSSYDFEKKWIFVDNIKSPLVKKKYVQPFGCRHLKRGLVMSEVWYMRWSEEFLSFSDIINVLCGSVLSGFGTHTHTKNLISQRQARECCSEHSGQRILEVISNITAPPHLGIIPLFHS